MACRLRLTRTVRLLALRQPMARDLREVFAALRIASGIERIGDHATIIAENVYLLVHGTHIEQTRHKGDTTALPVDQPH